jgi:hypothetical protein
MTNIGSNLHLGIFKRVDLDCICQHASQNMVENSGVMNDLDDQYIILCLGCWQYKKPVYRFLQLKSSLRSTDTHTSREQQPEPSLHMTNRLETRLANVIIAGQHLYMLSRALEDACQAL